MSKPFLRALPVALLPGIAAAIYLLNEGYPTLPALASALCLFLLFLPYFALGQNTAHFRNPYSIGRTKQSIIQVIGYYLAAYLIYAIGTRSLQLAAFSRLFMFLVIPAFLMFMTNPSRPIGLWDFLAVAALWIPFDMGWIPHIWPWPAGKGAYILNSVLATGFAVVLFSSYRCLLDIGYLFRFKYRDFGVAVLHFAVFFAIAYPLGKYLGFINYNGSMNVLKALGAGIGIFLFIAIPEELLFRGLLQNMLSKKLKSREVALIITSIAFGLSHLNNLSADGSLNWTYALMATLAGFAYGRAYIKTNNLMAPALVHAAVDAVWTVFLMK